MRVVLIHKGPSDTCPCDLCHADVALHPEAHIVFREDSMATEAYRNPDDGMCCDDHDRQGRTPEQQDANERICVGLFIAGALLVVAIVAYLWATGGAK